MDPVGDSRGQRDRACARRGPRALAIADAEQGIYRAMDLADAPLHRPVSAGRGEKQAWLQRSAGCVRTLASRNDRPHKLEAGGGCRSLRALPQWESCFAVVWALIDLGTVTFASEPLVLGQFGARPGELRSGGRRWRWFGALGQPAGAPAEPPPLPENEDRPT